MNIALGTEAPISARIIPATGRVAAAKNTSGLPAVNGNTTDGISAQMNDATAHGE